jgi:uncharacterized protein YdaU (DUF1376 family)
LNYYPFHLGDYAAHTAHLEPMEDLAYRRLLDLYYRTEKALPALEETCRLIRMKDFTAEVQAVLDEFFVWDEPGWMHARCEAEISKMQDKQAKARASAQASVNARSANAQRTLNERSPDVELPTPTPTPTPKEETRKRVAPPDGVDGDVWKSFLAVRRAKKAPLSELAMAGITREAAKAGWTLEAALSECVTRGWTAFKADWVTAKQTFAQQAADTARTTVPAKPGRDPALVRLEEDAAKAKPMSPEIRQALAQAVGRMTQ